MNKLRLGIGSAALLCLGACAEGPANKPDDFGYKGTGIAFGVSPLTLDSLTDACYSFSVVNGNNELVVGRGPGAVLAHNGVAGAAGTNITGTAMETVCASQFGFAAGGDISYVAPCDADTLPSNVATANNVHTVTLWVDALCISGNPLKTGDANWKTPGTPSNICVEMQPYVNPCGSAGCSLSVTCVENADTPVSFNLTIMGQADQGFFDIAVNFDDVFCSAKLDDCNDVDGPGGSAPAPIQTMFDPTTHQRIDTIVAAVACTAGPTPSGSPNTAVNTVLNFTNLTVACNDGSAGTLNLATVTQEGNLPLLLGGVFPAAVYYGTESLPDFNKVYTTVAIGIGTRSGCTLSWNVVPTSGAFTAASTTGVYTSYGYVNFAATATDATAGLGGTTCHANPLNGLNSAVKTLYAADAASPAGALTAFLAEDGAAVTAGFGPLGVVICGPTTCPALTGYTPTCNTSNHCEYARTSPTAGTWHEDDVWIYVPAGNFPMGAPATEVGSLNNERPVHAVTFAQGFFIGKYEVTTRTYEACEGATSCTLPSVADWAGDGWGLNRTSNARAPHPQNGVTWAQAGEICAWLGGRRLSEAEWEYAAKGPTTHRKYPWGDSPEPTCANGTAVWNEAGGAAGYGCGIGGTWPVGQKVAGLSAVGALDMAGNLWEWVEDCTHADYTGAPIDGSTWTTDCNAISSRVLRGGSFNDVAAVTLRGARRGNAAPPNRRAEFGARCLRPLP